MTDGSAVGCADIDVAHVSRLVALAKLPNSRSSHAEVTDPSRLMIMRIRLFN